jgi:hypothetical protein
MNTPPRVALSIGIAGSLLIAPGARSQSDLPSGVPDAQGAADVASNNGPSRVHLSMGTDITTAYFFRGIRQEDSGLIVQPYADIALDVLRRESVTLSLKVGTWNSFHGEATGAGTGDSFTEDWYECDVYAGVGVAVGRWSFDGRYYFYTSPSGAFGTVDEFDLSIAYDDTEHLGAWSLKPAVLLAVETGSNAADGGRSGTYLQLGVSPGFSFDAHSITDIAVTFPVSMGLSASNYYETAGGGGENDAFGFASVGAKVSVPLTVDKSWGVWTLSAGVQALFLGDAASTFNDGEDVEVIGTAGVSVSF